MVDYSEIIQVSGRLVRAMPRHAVVLELDRLIREYGGGGGAALKKKGPFDKKAYQRDYMKRRRARASSNPFE